MYWYNIWYIQCREFWLYFYRKKLVERSTQPKNKKICLYLLFWNFGCVTLFSWLGSFMMLTYIIFLGFLTPPSMVTSLTKSRVIGEAAGCSTWGNARHSRDSSELLTHNEMWQQSTLSSPFVIIYDYFTPVLGSFRSHFSALGGASSHPGRLCVGSSGEGNLWDGWAQRWHMG